MAHEPERGPGGSQREAGEKPTKAEGARLEAEAQRGRVVVYLPAEFDPASPEALHARLAGYADRAEGTPVVMLPALEG